MSIQHTQQRIVQRYKVAFNAVQKYSNKELLKIVASFAPNPAGLPTLINITKEEVFSLRRYTARHYSHK